MESGNSIIDLLEYDEKIIWTGCPISKANPNNKTLTDLIMRFVFLFISILFFVLGTISKCPQIWFIITSIFFVAGVYLVYSWYKLPKDIQPEATYYITSKRIIKIEKDMPSQLKYMNINEIDSIEEIDGKRYTITFVFRIDKNAKNQSNNNENSPWKHYGLLKFEDLENYSEIISIIKKQKSLIDNE